MVCSLPRQNIPLQHPKRQILSTIKHWLPKALCPNNGYFSILNLCKAHESALPKNVLPCTVPVCGAETAAACQEGRRSTACKPHVLRSTQTDVETALSRHAENQLSGWLAKSIYFHAICSLQLWNREPFLPPTCLDNFHRFSPDLFSFFFFFFFKKNLFGHSNRRWSWNKFLMLLIFWVI